MDANSQIDEKAEDGRSLRCLVILPSGQKAQDEEANGNYAEFERYEQAWAVCEQEFHGQVEFSPTLCDYSKRGKRVKIIKHDKSVEKTGIKNECWYAGTYQYALDRLVKEP